MLDSDAARDLSAVRSRTQELIAKAFQASDPTLIEAPPSSGKTTSTYELAATVDRPVTYLCGRTDLYDEARTHFEELPLTEPHFNSSNDSIDGDTTDSTKTFTVIPSPHRDCPSFQADTPGDETVLRELYSKGYSGRKLHYMDASTAPTPCGDECPYLQKLRGIKAAVESIDILIGHHSHAHRAEYVTDRIVVLDEFNADAFLSTYPDPDSKPIDDPRKVIPAFLEAVDGAESAFPTGEFQDLTDILVKRNDADAVAPVIEWFKSNGASRSDAQDFDFINHSLFEYDRDHLLAPLLTFSLFCMRRVGPQVEMAPHPEANLLDLWEAVGLNPSLRVVRDRNTGQMNVFRPPEFRQAHQVIGLDGIPTPALWNLLLPPGVTFNHKQVLTKSEFLTYLTEALDMSIVQIGSGMHHYAGGRLSPQDHDRFRAIKTLENNRFPLISTKKALQQYREYNVIADFVTQIRNFDNDESNLEFEAFKASNYASVKSSNAFEQDDLGVVMGTPFPGDDIVRLWAGLCGKGVDISGEGAAKTFGEFGDQIFEHLTHNQVVQAILRFGRDETVYERGGATVYVSTKALPTWFEPTDTIEVRTSEKQLAVLRELKKAAVDAERPALRFRTAPELSNEITNSADETEIATPQVRETLESLIECDIATVRRDHGRNGADLYGWSADTRIQQLAETHVICGDGHVYITSNDWPQADAS